MNSQQVIDLVNQILGRSGERVLNAQSRLLGELPDFDSMTVASILTALEERTGTPLPDDKLSADIFIDMQSLIRFVEQELQLANSEQAS